MITTRNVVPGKYRGVSVATVAVPLRETALRKHLAGRPAYRRTRFIVARDAGHTETALLRVIRGEDDALFSPITDIEVLAEPAECAYLRRPDTDTAVPSALAADAGAYAPQARAVVVEGRYSHVNFILNPAPLPIVVREVVPPHPGKLFDQASRVLAVAEELPPITLEPELIALDRLAAERPAPHYLLPCRGGGGEIPGARISYLDEHPEQADWTQIGCARSQEIHRWFYGSAAPSVDMCPLHLGRPHAGGLLTKCCLQEEHLTRIDSPQQVCVPWGASLEQVRAGLALVSSGLDPAWQPA